MLTRIHMIRIRIKINWALVHNLKGISCITREADGICHKTRKFMDVLRDGGEWKGNKDKLKGAEKKEKKLQKSGRQVNRNEI